MAFDIDRYTATSVSVHWDDLDLEGFRDDPLPAASLRTLRYMADVEYHTVCYTRDLLTTPSHREADVSAFMTMWNREEFWHGEALAAVLAMHDITVDYDVLKASRLKLGWKDRLDPIKQSVLGSLVGADFVAVHMSWGAANEWSAITRVPAHGGAGGASGARRTAAPHREAGGQTRGLLHIAGARAARGEHEGAEGHEVRAQPLLGAGGLEHQLDRRRAARHDASHERAGGAARGTQGRREHQRDARACRA